MPPPVSDTQKAVQEGLRAALVAHMGDVFETSLNTRVVTDAHLSTFRGTIADLARRYDQMVQAANEAFKR